MADHHVWRVIKHPKDHITAIVGCIVIVGALTALTVFTTNTHQQTVNVEHVVKTQQEIVVRSLCTRGITQACKKKAFTLIRGCLSYKPCRELLIKGEDSFTTSTLKPGGGRTKIGSGLKPEPTVMTESTQSPEATTNPFPDSFGDSSPPHHSHHHSHYEPSSPGHQSPPQGQEGSPGGSSPESGGGSSPEPSPGASGGSPVTNPPPDESGEGTASKGGFEETVNGVGKTVEEVTKPLCEPGLLGVRVCIPR